MWGIRQLVLLVVRDAQVAMPIADEGSFLLLNPGIAMLDHVLIRDFEIGTSQSED